MKIAVIPARGGSKRIPRKNVKEFCGRPMIEWAISVALESKLFDHIIVSTDDKEIGEIARSCGAKTPFIRPNELADDLTPTVPVVAHALKLCLDIGLSADYACCIYPCVPFLSPDDLKVAFEQIQKEGANFIYPVSEYVHPIQRAMRQLSTGQMQFINPENELLRTQDFEKVYHDCGQFYWGLTSAWIQQKKMHTDGLGLVLPSWRFVDIDTVDDWNRAEDIYKARMKRI